MLKFFAHCWLILSLLVAPLQFAAADMAVVDHAQMKCEMMDMQAQHEMPQNDMQGSSMDHSMGQDGCECPEQCKVSCASAHMGMGLNSMMQFMPVYPISQVSALTTSIHGIDHLTELRPPIA